MDKFPDPIPPPPSYLISRAKRKRDLVFSIWKGVALRFLIIIAEFVGYLFFASVSLLYDAIASGLDIVFSFILILGIRWAAMPPDDDHPFGHGRLEPLAGLQLSLCMALGGIYLAVKQMVSFFADEPVGSIHPWVWIIPLIAVVALEGAYRMVIRYAVKHNSPALKADAVHFRIDALNSLFATAALLLAAFFPGSGALIDKGGAFFIALLMVVIGFLAARDNFHQVMDRKPDPEYFRLIRKKALDVEGVLGTEKLRIQLSGPDAHVDIDIEVDPSLNIEEGHRISQRVRASVQEAWPSVRDVIVHIEPYYPGDH